VITKDVFYDNVRGRAFNRKQISNINILKSIVPTSFGRFLFALGIKYAGFPIKIDKFLSYDALKNTNLNETPKINVSEAGIVKSYIIFLLFSENSGKIIKSFLMDNYSA
jgi:hypothetical protein